MSSSVPETRPPRRGILRLAGILTQLICAGGLLIGTVAFVIVKQNAHGAGIEFVIGWLVAAMLGLVSGGLVYRGSIGSLVICAAVDAALGSVLLLVDSALGVLVRIMSAADVDTLATLLRVLAIGMIVVGGLCLVAIPQARRYARWLAAGSEPSPASTLNGFPPPPIPTWRRSMQHAIVDASSRRTFWFVIGGIAVGVGAGIAVITSGQGSSTASPADPVAKHAPAADAGVKVAVADAGVTPHLEVPPPGDAAVKAAVDAGVPADAAPGGGGPSDSLDALLSGEAAAIAKADTKALAALAASNVCGFGLDADELIDGRASFAAAIAHDLGAPPPGGFDIDTKFLQLGQEREHAWIAEELEIVAHGKSRRFEITQLLGKVDKKWTIIAWHWGIAVPDAAAARLVAAGTMPALKPVTDAHAGVEPIYAAVRGAFSSTSGYSDSLADRSDAFNFGSGGERVAGGRSIKRVFSGLNAELKIHDGVRVVPGGAWDASQSSSPWIALAMANVDFTMGRTKQTFRILTILVRERSSWRVVQTQWTNGGPLRL